MYRSKTSSQVVVCRTLDEAEELKAELEVGIFFLQKALSCKFYRTLCHKYKYPYMCYMYLEPI